MSVLPHYTFSRKVSCSNLNTNQHLLPVCGSPVLRGFEQLMDLQETVWFCRCRGRFGPEPRCSEGVKSQEAKKTKKNFPFQMKPSASQPLPSFPFLPSFPSFLPPSVRRRPQQQRGDDSGRGAGGFGAVRTNRFAGQATCQKRLRSSRV